VSGSLKAHCTGLVSCATLAIVGCGTDRLIICAGSTIGSGRAALLNGSEQAEFLGLAPTEQAAIVQLETNAASGEALGSCSGVAIGARWLLSAAHCVPEGDSARIVISLGQNAHAPEGRLEAVLVSRHPDLDLSVLELAEDAPELTPLPLSSRLPAQGSVVQLAGFGEDELGQLGRRRFLAEVVSAVEPESIVVDGGGRSGACRGDSGGPLLVRDWNGSAAIAGVLRGGDLACTGVDRYTRIDLARAWIDAHVRPASASAACGTISSEGRCFEGLATWCQAGALQAQACGAGLQCGWDSSAGGFRCVVPAADPCAGVDDRGRCAGPLLVRCNMGVLERIDCATCGSSCGRDPESGTVACERADSKPLPNLTAGAP
jgi:hypothetical protein